MLNEGALSKLRKLKEDCGGSRLSATKLDDVLCSCRTIETEYARSSNRRSLCNLAKLLVRFTRNEPAVPAVIAFVMTVRFFFLFLFIVTSLLIV